MKAPCQHDCGENWVFPKRPENRPGLGKIDYRIGRYADFRDILLRQLNLNPTLRQWTYREADDPGIALLEGSAILADILAFYQDLYANEAFLRTAQWRESVANLVRLLGYRMSPGLGSSATFAFEISGQEPVVIPAGYPVKAQLDDDNPPADFETAAQVNAVPGLSRFSLYRELADQPITPATREFFISATEDNSSQELKTGDRLIMAELCPDAIDRCFHHSDLAVIESVRDFHGRKIYKLKGSLQKITSAGQVVGMKVSRTFNHFGAAVPEKIIVPPTAVDALPTSRTANYYRHLGTTGNSTDLTPQLQPDDFPLDQAVDDLTVGNRWLVQFLLKGECGGAICDESPDPTQPCAKLRQVIGIDKKSCTMGNTSNFVSVITLDEKLWDDAAESLICVWDTDASAHRIAVADVRTIRLHELSGPMLTMHAAPQDHDTDATGGYLSFYGSTADAAALLQREILIQNAAGVVKPCTVSAVDAPVSVFESTAGACRIGFTQNLEYAWFPHEANQTTVYGNLAAATQGETQKQKILGNGDNRQAFQTFKLPKAPLTYLLNTAATPPETPELEIWVNDRLWTRADRFYDCGPGDEIYIVREDEQGDSWVQFGDGQTGCRVPSGLNNIKAIFRVGHSANGHLKAGVTVQPGKRLDRLKKIDLPGEALGGSENESADNARLAAPGKVQSLGRLVSLADFENEALAVSNVAKVKARWGMLDNSFAPAVILTLLMSGSQSDEAFAEIIATMNGYNRDRGPERFPILGEKGVYKYITVGLTFGYDRTMQPEEISAQIQAALGVPADGKPLPSGLMSINHRDFKQPEYHSRVQGVVQSVSGVVWVKIDRFRDISPEDVMDGEFPSGVWEKVSCNKNQILVLKKEHLTLNPVPVERMNRHE